MAKAAPPITSATVIQASTGQVLGLAGMIVGGFCAVVIYTANMATDNINLRFDELRGDLQRTSDELKLEIRRLQDADAVSTDKRSGLREIFENKFETVESTVGQTQTTLQDIKGRMTQIEELLTSLHVQLGGIAKETGWMVSGQPIGAAELYDALQSTKYDSFMLKGVVKGGYQPPKPEE